METLDAIKTRRSIRKYKSEQIPVKTIQTLLEAAMQAPSAGNEQPWHFIVIIEKELLGEIAKFNPYADMAGNAAFAILVCGDVNQEKYDNFWIQDCAAATQNLLLAAHDLGLGAVWTAVYPMGDRAEKYSSFFKLPSNIIPLALVPVGYPDQVRGTENRFKEDRIHFNRW